MERELINWLKSEFGNCRHARLGIGDDCAIMPPGSADTIVTCDAVCDGVHFRSTEHSPEQIGYKALAVNLSDLASMGATPLCATVSLAIPSGYSLDYVKRLYDGMKPLVNRFQIDICGGDTNVWDGGLVLSITAIGVSPAGGAWRINRARPGDRILVTGQFGGSIAGHHLSFVPRCDFAEQWRDRELVRACTDVSDSLGLDLVKIARASGTGFVIDRGSIPISDAAKKLAASSKGPSALDHALGDGEDFELIVIATQEHAAIMIGETPKLIGLTDIGVMTAETGFFIAMDGSNKQFQPIGYEHQLKVR